MKKLTLEPNWPNITIALTWAVVLVGMLASVGLWIDTLQSPVERGLTRIALAVLAMSYSMYQTRK